MKKTGINSAKISRIINLYLFIKLIFIRYFIIVTVKNKNYKDYMPLLQLCFL